MTSADDVLAVKKTLESGPIIIAEYTRDFMLGLSSVIYKCKVNNVYIPISSTFIAYSQVLYS